jgi:energy-converting hydrogenase Eha subunit H
MIFRFLKKNVAAIFIFHLVMTILILISISKNKRKIEIQFHYSKIKLNICIYKLKERNIRKILTDEKINEALI